MIYYYQLLLLLLLLLLLILDFVAANIPEIYLLVHPAYSCEPILSFGDHEILSREGAQQADPLESLEFCEAIHPLLIRLYSTVKIGLINDTLYQVICQQLRTL